MEKINENNLVEIVGLEKCKNEGHVKGTMIKRFNGVGRYCCTQCGNYFYDHLIQSEKNVLDQSEKITYHP